MKTFDEKFSAEMLRRLDALPVGATPRWGTMNRGQLIGHITSTLRYTMGAGPDLPFKGNFLSRTLFRFAILSGLRSIPRNVRLPRPSEVPKEAWFTEGDYSALVDAVAAYHEAVRQGTLGARMHAFFGVMSPSQWRRLHYLHFVHHMRQFGIDEGL